MILVNGKKIEWRKSHISYEELHDIVYPLALPGDCRYPSMTWRNAASAGSISKGMLINVTEGMVFNVVVTGNA